MPAPGVLRRIGQGTAGRRGRRAQRGSISVELAVLAPGLVVLLLLVAAGGRVVEVQGHIDGAAREAARAASIARSYGQAVTAAQQAAQAELGSTSLCAPGTVVVRVAGYPAVPVATTAGASVTVTVTSTSLVALNGQLTVNPGGQTITVILSVSL